MLRRRNLFQERYNHFLTELKNEILSGSLKPGEFILPENTLSEKYKISRVSVRKVLAQLVDEGLIEKIAGKGNRVKPPVEEIVRQTITLTWFSQSYEQDVLHTIIERYEKSHPYVKVDLVILPAEDYPTRLADRIERGTGPDLFFISDHHFRHLMEQDKLNVMEPYQPPKLLPDEDSYSKLFELFTVDDTLMAVPIHFSPIVICYNKDRFKESGITGEDPVSTWDDLLEVAKKCTAEPNEDGMVDEYGFCFSSSMNRWPAFILQNGGAFVSPDGRSAFATETNIEALQYCNDLIYKHQVSPIYSTSRSYLAEHLFKREKCAMMLSTYYFMNEFRGMDLNWDVLPVPKNKEKATLLLAGSLGINKYSEKVKVAQSFVDFFVGEEAQTLLKQTGCTIPVLRSVAEDDTLLDPAIHPEHYNVFIDSLKYSYSHYEVGLSNESNVIFHEELHMLWANMETAENVARRIDERINQRIDEKS
ncbi:extracellular solute-binding protein [Paenibacillus oceani]|uniref:Extracellular solute-binding protein n=1 Tax=Paenibacillus oceani TaxID=2772510 RepID=A0A927CIL8_9BACL|nr:extracellular solute-binding protein [Paenibacillus oceani]MBD2866395.1 extracellular solute-binding protein [Paenibacillus oceani]